MWYMGKEFKKEENKQYKTLEGGLKAAQKQKLNLYDEDGTVVHEEKAQKAQEETEVQQEGNSAPEEEKGQDGAGIEATEADEEEVHVESVELTDDVPDGALETQPDGSVPAFDESGEQTGSISAVQAETVMQQATEMMPDVTEVRGKLRRVFDGMLRVRNAPSWDESAKAGVTNFTEKNVKKLHLVDGKPMYETTDGYFISGDKELVEFIPE